MESALRAGLLIPNHDLTLIPPCLQVAEALDAEVVEVLNRWSEWVTAVREGELDIAVVPDRQMLPAGRLPRIVSPSDWRQQPPPLERRPHWR